jgi:tetratricopeptide (TPR) repeat protein
MARFDKLEFNAPDETPDDQPELRRADLDESHWMKRADENRRQGLYENALKYYSRALERDRSVVTGWVGQVQMLVLLDEFREADVWGRKALELFPNQADLLAGRAQACCRLGDLKQAHALCDGAIHQQGLSAYPWTVRGELMLAGRQQVEQHCFDKAQQLSRDWLVPLEIAVVCLYYKNPSKAINRVRRAVEIAPDAYYAWYVQGLCQTRLGFDRQARQSFEQCLNLCPRHADSLSRLAEIESQTWSPARLWRRLFGGS